MGGKLCPFERTWRNERTSDAKQVVDIVDIVRSIMI